MNKHPKILIPFSYRLIRGAIGKRIVIKHYRYGVVVAKYPNMDNICPSTKQAMCRKLFKEAVALAKIDYADAAKKLMWNEKLRYPVRLFGAIVKVYLQQLNTAKAERVAEVNAIIRKCFAQAEPGIIITEKAFNIIKPAFFPP